MPQQGLVCACACACVCVGGLIVMVWGGGAPYDDWLSPGAAPPVMCLLCARAITMHRRHTEYPACGCHLNGTACFNQTRGGCNSTPKGSFGFMGYTLRTAEWRCERAPSPAPLPPPLPAAHCTAPLAACTHAWRHALALLGRPPHTRAATLPTDASLADTAWHRWNGSTLTPDWGGDFAEEL
jgi:hypothetical protein